MNRLPIRDFVELVAEMDDSVFDKLASDLLGPDKFDVDPKRCDHLGRKLGLDADVVEALVGIVRLMYEGINPASGPSATPDQLLGIIADIVGEARTPSTHGRLTRLFTRSADVDHYLAVCGLKSGYVAQAVRFSSVVDLRVMPSNDMREVTYLVPLVQFKVITEESGSAEGATIFQLDAKSLESLEDAVRAARDKLDIIRNATLSNVLINN